MQRISRRTWIERTAATIASTHLLAGKSDANVNVSRTRKFTMNLSCGSIGVGVDQRGAIKLASKYGFEAVSADPGFLAKLTDEENSALLEEMTNRDLVWGVAGLPLRIGGSETGFAEGMKELPKYCRALQRAGADRVGTWISPAHQRLTYLENFAIHVRRLKQVGKLFQDYQLRLGLEYIGPKTLWASNRHSFIHTMAETKELLGEVGCDNIGFVLDSWHWFTAHETLDDLLTLSNAEIIACDLNDAPAGIAVDQQIDSRRELPCATGVIDVKGFLEKLLQIGFDGPIRAEPFNDVLNQMDDDSAVAKTAESMKKAFGLVDA